MNDSAKKIVFGALVGLPTLVLVWLLSLYFLGCGSTNSCTGLPQLTLTPVPTLRAATMPAPNVGADAVTATPKCSVTALNLIGAWVSSGYSEKDAFAFSDLNGQNCAATFKDDVRKLFITPNLWYDGAPACTTCHYADLSKAIKNMDLSSYTGILAGSNRVNNAPKGNDILGGGKWADALLHKMLFAPNGKTETGRPPMPLGRPATVPAEGPVISAGEPSGAGTTASKPASTPATAATSTSAEIARPSNPGSPGEAVGLKGDATVGASVYVARCQACHGVLGKKGIPNPGSEDGSVLSLNPINSTLVSADLLTYVTNLDLFIQHGSKPAGPSPAIVMPAWGDQNLLSQQEIANVIAYIIGLNK